RPNGPAGHQLATSSLAPGAPARTRSPRPRACGRGGSETNHLDSFRIACHTHSGRALGTPIPCSTSLEEDVLDGMTCARGRGPKRWQPMATQDEREHPEPPSPENHLHARRAEPPSTSPRRINKAPQTHEAPE